MRSALNCREFQKAVAFGGISGFMMFLLVLLSDIVDFVVVVFCFMQILNY